MASKKPWILGLSGSHGGAAALLHGDVLAVAIQEERVCRVKRAILYAGRPSAAVRYCLDAAGIGPGDLDLVVTSCLLSAHERTGGSDNSHPLHDWRLNPDLAADTNHVGSLSVPRHFAHAVSAFATSGFQDACVVVIDGAGSPMLDWLPSEAGSLVRPNRYDNREWLSIYMANGTSLTPLEKQVIGGPDWVTFDGDGRMPSFGSLGGMYDAVSFQLFGTFGQGGEVMALAPYGRAVHPPAAFYHLDGCRFEFLDAVPRMYRSLARGGSQPTRRLEADANLAASVQHALENAVLAICRHARELTGAERLCLAGSVALNGLANERIDREAGFDDVFVFPAAEESGVAVGAAYWGLWQRESCHAKRRWTRDATGRVYGNDRIADALRHVPFVRARRGRANAEEVAAMLASGAILGWFQEGSELGSCALGQRSILCDPRRQDAKDVLNAKIKLREPFLPFAAAVRLEEVPEWFEVDRNRAESPFMLRACSVRPGKRAAIPAVVHVDGTARLQTLTRDGNTKFYELVAAFERLTGVPVVLSTSFCVSGEPLVETPEDALWSLLFTELTGCILGDQVCEKDSPAATALDLVPYAARPMSDQEVRISLGGGGYAAQLGYRAPPAANLTARLPGLPIPLTTIDGVRTGRQLAACHPNVTEAALLRSLAILRRVGIIGFRG